MAATAGDENNFFRGRWFGGTRGELQAEEGWNRYRD